MVRVSYRAICLEGHMFGGPYLFSRDLLPFLATMHIVSSYSYVYILFMRTRYMDIYTHVLEGSENGNPCEPQIRCMRASDTTYVAEEVEAFLSRENKSGSGLCSPRLLFFLQSCTPCVFLSISALAPFSGGSSTNRSDFSGSAVQHGLQFSLE